MSHNESIPQFHVKHQLNKSQESCLNGFFCVVVNLVGNQVVLPDCGELSEAGTPEASNCKRIGVQAETVHLRGMVNRQTASPVREEALLRCDAYL